MANYSFKIASHEAEFEQIHRLNYQTFVEEIPQHQPNPERRLIDKFHSENCYLICLAFDCLAGMVAIRDIRPFSLDEKLADLDGYLPPYRSICEIRLLAIDPRHRNGTVFGGLLQMAFSHRLSQGYDLAVMSGTVRQLKLYKRLGFIPFGPLVGIVGAQYQPMYWTLKQLRKSVPWLKTMDSHVNTARPFQSTVNLLPGPIAVQPSVQSAFEAEAISHRRREFVADIQTTKQLLLEMTNAQAVELFLGGGTLANDAIALQLRLNNRPGLILSNGEFGRRLIGHARRAGLRAEVLPFELGEPFDYQLIEKKLSGRDFAWLWAVHCETSSGILNDLSYLRYLCSQTGTELCLDAVSSLGLVPVDLSDVYLTSAVSGKGLASFSGLAMVFYNHTIKPRPNELPAYLDLGYFATCEGVPFTISSNLLCALNAALEVYNFQERYERVRRLSSWCRSRIEEIGLTLLASEEHSAPAVLSLILPERVDSYRIGCLLEQNGYHLSFASPYLIERNIIQLCLFSDLHKEQLWPLFQLIKYEVKNRQGSPETGCVDIKSGRSNQPVN